MSDNEDFHSAPEDNDEVMENDVGCSQKKTVCEKKSDVGCSQKKTVCEEKSDVGCSQKKTVCEKKSDVVDSCEKLSDLHIDGVDKKTSNNSLSSENFSRITEKEDANEKVQEETASSWPTWGSWGVTDLISSASKGATTLTSQVSHGLSSILETGLGAPDPSVLAKDLAQKDAPCDQLDSSSNLTPEFGLTNLVGGITSMGNKVLTGGLDTLETLGKMTMEVLQEGDPGFRKKRMLFTSDKTLLSEILREAKENDETCGEGPDVKPHEQVHYETLFDDFYGLMHLEALEMLSKQCDLKIKSMKSSFTPDDFETLKEIKDICTMPGPEDKEHLLASSSEIFVQEFRNIFESLDIAVKIDLERFLQISLNSVLDNLKFGNEIHHAAITDLALSTANLLNVFHQLAENIMQKKQRSPTSEVTEIVRMATTGCAWIDSLLVHYSSLLDKTVLAHPEVKSQSEECKASIQTETAHSINYLITGLELFVPILQLGALS